MLRRWWPLVVVLLFQFGALAVMPMRSASARLEGREIRLQTIAVDPFDPLAGRYVVLRYRAESVVSSPARDLEEGDVVWLTVERASPAWIAAGLEPRPLPPSSDRLSLRARWRGGRAVIENAGRLYMREERCLEADKLLQEDPDAGFVVLAVDSAGNATPLRLELAGRVFP